MTDKYCPSGEVKKLEIELWNLKIRDNNIPAYINRFQELALICTKFVSNETEKVDKYINGLPNNIYGNVKSSKPKTLDETIEAGIPEADTPPQNMPLLATLRPGCEKDRAAVRVEFEVLRSERLAYEQEVLKTHARRLEWQRQATDDLAVQHIMRTQALEAGARDDTLEDTAQAKKNMIVYLKNMAGYKIAHFKGMTYDQVKYPFIDWEIYSEGSRTYLKIIRVGRIIQAYRNFEDMFKEFDREDLDAPCWFASNVEYNATSEDCEMDMDLVMKIFMEANKPKSKMSLDTSSN
nr:reverse transcriptase domain-containing protein [Tanacetum cinerariifolium]